MADLLDQLRSGEGRAVVDVLGEGVIVIDQDGRVLLRNPSAVEVLGLGPVTGERVPLGAGNYVLYDEAGHALTVEELPTVQALRTGRSRSGVLLRLVRADGDVRWLSVSSGPLTRPGEPAPYAAVASFVDVTESRRLAEELRLLQELALVSAEAADTDRLVTAVLSRLCCAVDAVAGQLWAPDRDRTGLVCLPAWSTTDPRLEPFHDADVARPVPLEGSLLGRAFSGTPATTTTVAPAPDFLRVDHLAGSGLAALLAVPVLSGSEVVAVLELLGTDEVLTSEPVVRLVTSAGAQLGGVLRRRQTEAELRRAEDRLHAFLDAMPTLANIKDLDGRYLMVNRAFCELFGMSARELVGRRPSELVPGAEARLIDRHAQEVLRTGQSQTFEEEATIGGVLHSFLSSRFPLRDAGGRIYATAGVSTDTTWQAEVDEVLHEREALSSALVEELERTNEELRDAVVFRDELLAMTSHELRTPLAAVLGYTSLLVKHGPRLPEAKREDYLRTVLAEAQRLSRLVEDLLTLSRLRAGAERVERVPVRVRELLDRLPVVVPAADLDLDAPPDLQVVADPGRLEQVLVNLVENAVRYGGGRVEVSARRDTAENGTESAGDGRAGVLLSVRDHGPGVPEEFVPRLFDSFAQASTGTTRTSTGSGLGLAIVRGLVRAHDGNVSYAPAPGGGALFTVRLPDSSP